MLTGLQLDDLADTIDIDIDYLTAIVARDAEPYESGRLPKRSGGFRHIDLPEGRLAHFQRQFLHLHLHKVAFHPAAHGFVPGRSAVKCASKHLGARWLLRIDLRSFFSSIDERDVYHTIRRNLDADRLLAFQLARLLTRQGSPTHPDAAVRKSSSFVAPHLSYGRVYNRHFPPAILGYLPQGAPTSGAIANLVARYLDDRLSQFAADSQLMYTRYADDLHFSSHTSASTDESRRRIGEVYGVVRAAGFEPNLRKTRVFGPGSTPRMLGLYVDGSHLRLRKRLREEIDQTLRAIDVFGIDQHASHRGEEPTALLERLEGQLRYAQGVDRAWSRPRQAALRRIVEMQE